MPTLGDSFASLMCKTDITLSVEFELDLSPPKFDVGRGLLYLDNVDERAMEACEALLPKAKAILAVERKSRGLPDKVGDEPFDLSYGVRLINGRLYGVFECRDNKFSSRGIS